MSYDEAVTGISLPANADLTSGQFLFAKLANASGVAQVAVCGDGQDAIGSIYEGGNAAGAVTKVATAGVVKVVAGGNITAGARVCSDASGKAVTTGTGKITLGFALTSAVSGDVIPVLLNNNGVVA